MQQHYYLAYLARRCSTKMLLTLIVLCMLAVIALLGYCLTVMNYSGGIGRRHYLFEDTYQGIEENEKKYHIHSEGIGGNEYEVHKFARDKIVDIRNPSGSAANNNVTIIAIGCAITSHLEENLSLENLAYKLPFLKTLVPSFCRTASIGYNYRFYISFDSRDPHLGRQEYLAGMHERFTEIVDLLCPKKSKVSLHFVQCRHNRNPTWAQNDAMMEAYLDHVDYYYRVNDDTHMLSPGWTETFIEGLLGFSPPNVGVVGPLHKGGNEEILTYDFVHRTHIDIFGYYYPRIFTDWWADNWMTTVYGSLRTLKLPSVRLLHTGEAGTRYDVKPHKEMFLKEQVEEDQTTLSRYLRAVKLAMTSSPPLHISPHPSRHIISMSLWGAKTRYTFGALRNAQLAPVYFPGWTLRMYVERARDDGSTMFPPAPERILTKLEQLGVELVSVDAERSRVPPMMWRFLVADDIEVDVFIVRDSDCRLSDRDAAVVQDWLSSSSSSSSSPAPFHCIRDHPSHAGYPVLGGLWGGRPQALADLIAVPWRDLMMGYRSDYSQDMGFLANAIWPKVVRNAVCHDSIACMKWTPPARPFPVQRIGTEHLGQVFDAFGNVHDTDIQLILDHRPVKECTVANATVTLGPSFDQSPSITEQPVLFNISKNHELTNQQKLPKLSNEEKSNLESETDVDVNHQQTNVLTSQDKASKLQSHLNSDIGTPQHMVVNADDLAVVNNQNQEKMSLEGIEKRTDTAPHTRKRQNSMSIRKETPTIEHADSALQETQHQMVYKVDVQESFLKPDNITELQERESISNFDRQGHSIYKAAPVLANDRQVRADISINKTHYGLDGHVLRTRSKPVETVNMRKQRRLTDGEEGAVNLINRKESSMSNSPDSLKSDVNKDGQQGSVLAAETSQNELKHIAFAKDTKFHATNRKSFSETYATMNKINQSPAEKRARPRNDRDDMRQETLNYKAIFNNINTSGNIDSFGLRKFGTFGNRGIDSRPAGSRDTAALDVSQQHSAAIVWSMDYHVGPIRAIKSLALSEVRFIDKSLAAGCKRLHTCASDLRVITRSNGLEITPVLADAFRDEYETDPEMRLVTHFLCTYPAAMCELYVGFGKMIVVYINSRYEQGHYTASRWARWNKWIAEFAANPHNLLLAGNHYDARYVQYFTGLLPHVIPLHCAYVTAANMQSNQSSLYSTQVVLLANVHNPSFSDTFLKEFANQRGKFSIEEAGRTAPSLDKVFAIVHIPRQASTSDFCEHYAGNIPLFVPTINLAIRWHHQYAILSHLTWNSVRSLLSDSGAGSRLNAESDSSTSITDKSPIKAAAGFESTPDPNSNLDDVSLRYWLPFIDVYQRPNITYFDSIAELVRMLDIIDRSAVTLAMMHKNMQLRTVVEDEWKKVFRRS